MGRADRAFLRLPAAVIINPFEFAVAFVSFLIGAVLLVSGADSHQSGLAEAPGWAVRLWQLQMVLAGPVTSLGMLWRGGNAFTGLQIEKAGLYLLASAWGTRAIVLLLSEPGAGAIVAVPIYLSVAFACQIRASSIQRAVEVSRKAAEEGP